MSHLARWIPLRLLTALGLVFMGLETLAQAPAHAATNTESATVAMPFDGRWAWGNDSPAEPWDDNGDSHPVAHELWSFSNSAGWGTDLYPPANTSTDVKLRVDGTGPVTFSNVTTWPSRCGEGVKFAVKVNGVEVGQLAFAHLVDAPTSVSNNTVIGQVETTCGAWTDHLHFEAVNEQVNYSCYTDYGSPGTQVSQGHSLGRIGSDNTGAKEACPASPSVGAGNLLQAGSMENGETWSTKDGGNVTNRTSSYGLPRDGGRFLTANDGGSGGSIYKDIPGAVEEGERFTVSAWVHSNGSGSVATGRVTIFLRGGDGATVESRSVKYATGYGWNLVQATVDANESHHNGIRVQVYPGSGITRLDTVSVTRSLLQAGSMENGETWNTMNGGNATNRSLSDGSPYDGNRFQTINSGGTSGSIYKDIAVDVEQGERFTVSAWLRSYNPGTTAAGTAQIFLRGGSGATIESRPVQYSAGDDWMLVQATVDANQAHPNGIRVQFYPANGSPVVAIDTVSVTRSLLRAGSMENGETWSIKDGGNVTNRTSSYGLPRDGGRFLTANDGGSGGSIYKDIPGAVEEGERFTVTLWVKAYTSTANGSAQVFLRGGGGASVEARSVTYSVDGHGWVPLQATIDATQRHPNGIRVQVYPGNGITAVDAVSVG